LKVARLSQHDVQTGLLGSAVDVAPAAFFVLDEEGRFVAANRYACAMLCYSREDLLGLAIDDVALSGDLSRLLAAARRSPQVGIAPLRRRDGDTILVRYEARAASTEHAGFVVCVAHARRVLPGDVTQGAAARKPRSKDNRELTKREAEILQLVADGFENDEISGQLYISKETVKTHVRRLLQKLGARSRTHAVSVGLRRGLID
jgi:PAS domain S-box-containing protein